MKELAVEFPILLIQPRLVAKSFPIREHNGFALHSKLSLVRAIIEDVATHGEKEKAKAIPRGS
jgi:hypothetical protein